MLEDDGPWPNFSSILTKNINSDGFGREKFQAKFHCCFCKPFNEEIFYTFHSIGKNEHARPIISLSNRALAILKTT